MEQRPFLKWAGGKRQLLPLLLPRAPEAVRTYYEPFVGGGALYFAIASGGEARPARIVLNDLIAELMATYATVRDRPSALVGHLSRLERRYLALDGQDRDRMYSAVRNYVDPDVAPVNTVHVAARLIFLNKTCFNGLYRENRKGRFNVPHGRYDSPNIADANALLAASRALQGVTLRRGDFVRACADAAHGDFVYLDPPFHPLSRTSNFTTYTGKDFRWKDQLRLRELIEDLTSRGASVMLSNSAHPSIRKLYGDSRYWVEEVPARRAINSRGDRRGVIDELLITNYEPAEAGSSSAK